MSHVQLLQIIIIFIISIVTKNKVISLYSHLFLAIISNSPSPNWLNPISKSIGNSFFKCLKSWFTKRYNSYKYLIRKFYEAVSSCIWYLSVLFCPVFYSAPFISFYFLSFYSILLFWKIMKFHNDLQFEYQWPFSPPSMALTSLHIKLYWVDEKKEIMLLRQNKKTPAWQIITSLSL